MHTEEEQQQQQLTSGLQDDAEQQAYGDEAQRKLVILGIPWETQSETLRTYFSQFCPVQDAVVMRDRYTGKSRGFGFVTFFNANDAQRVAAAEHVVDGRRCDAKLALPKSSSTSGSAPAKVPRIFVARVPQTISDEQFKAYWEEFGPVQDAYMPKDVSKAGHRGIGFVTFQAADALERVMATTHTIHGTELAVDRAEPKASERWPAMWLTGRPGAGGMPQFAAQALLQQLNGYPEAYGQGSQAQRRQDLPATLDDANVASTSQALSGGLGFAGGDSQGVNKPLANLSEAERTALEQYALSSSSLDPQRLQLAQSALQQVYARGSANPRTVQALQGLSFGGSGQGIGIGLGLMQNQGQLPSSSGRGLEGGDAAWMMQAGRGGEAGERGRPPLAAIIPTPGAAPGGASRPNGPRIFVGKLNKDTTEGDVKDYFSKFGYVMDVYMPRDKMNRSDHRGFGFVTFETQGALARIMTHEQPHTIRGTVIAIDDAAPRRDDGATPGPRPPSGPAPPQETGTSAAQGTFMQPMELLEGPSNGDESMGPARRHADGIRNGYKPY